MTLEPYQPPVSPQVERWPYEVTITWSAGRNRWENRVFVCDEPSPAVAIVQAVQRAIAAEVPAEAIASALVISGPPGFQPLMVARRVVEFDSLEALRQARGQR